MQRPPCNNFCIESGLRVLEKVFVALTASTTYCTSAKQSDLASEAASRQRIFSLRDSACSSLSTLLRHLRGSRLVQEQHVCSTTPLTREVSKGCCRNFEGRAWWKKDQEFYANVSGVAKGKVVSPFQISSESACSCNRQIRRALTVPEGARLDCLLGNLNLKCLIYVTL